MERISANRVNLATRKAFDERDWDTEIDCLLDAIIHNDSDKEQSSSFELGDSVSPHHSQFDDVSVSPDEEDNQIEYESSTETISTLHNKNVETAIITIQSKGLLPSRRNRRKLRKQLLAKHPPTFKPTMRVMKRDIRKKYCEMMNNVINNHDGLLMKQFLEQFCLPNVNIYDPQPNGPASVIKSKPCNITGINEITQTWITGFELMPDCTFQLFDSYIFATPNHNRSRIVSKVVFRGTKVFDLIQDLPYLSSLFTKDSNNDNSKNSMLNSFQQLPQVKSIIDLVKNTIGYENLQQMVQFLTNPESKKGTGKDIKEEKTAGGLNNNNFLLDNFQIFNLISCFQQLSILTNPIHYTVEGVLTTFLDESNRILNFQFDCTNLKTDMLTTAL